MTVIYVPKSLEPKARALVDFDRCGNIHRSGSVIGMRKQFGWQKGGQVRLGMWIYNLGPLAVQRLRDALLTRS